jgi:maltose-binding protein MalE
MGIVPVFIAAPMLLAACGGDATPTTAPAATATTGAGAVATATTGSSAVATATKGTAAGATATTGSASGSEGVPTGSADLTIWYGYTGAEADTFTKALNDLKTANPNFKVTALAVPFDSLQSKFTTEAATGGGPDVLLGANDWAGPLADAGLLADLGSMSKLSSVTANLVPSSLDVSKYNGKQVGITANLKNVALYYNSDLVKSVPKNTDDMLTQASSLATGNVKYGLALNAGFYQAVGYNYAFGGKLFNADNKSVDLTTQGTQDWLNFYKKAAGTPGVFVKAGADSDIDTFFKTGQAAMVINGPWALGDYQKALGKDKVKVAVAPDTPTGGKFAPFVGGDVYYVNAASKNQDAALALIGYMMSTPVQQNFVNDAGQISTNTKVDLSTNAALQAFVDQSKQGTPFPNFSAMSAVWTPGGDMITSVLDGKADAAAAAKTANDAINTAIKAMP